MDIEKGGQDGQNWELMLRGDCNWAHCKHYRKDGERRVEMFIVLKSKEAV